MSLTWRGWSLLMLFFLPWLSVFVAGLWWLWENNWWILWLLTAMLTTVLLWAGRRWWSEQLIELPELDAVNPKWSPREEEAWEKFQVKIQALDPADYPVDKQLLDKVLHLSLDLSLDIAQHYYPKSKEPRLAVPLPELIHAAERVCHDLRKLTVQVPFSHVVTTEQLFTLHNYYQRYGDKTQTAIRISSLLINPQISALNELRMYLLGQALDFSRQEILRWVLQSYAQWVVRHTIDLYSGHQKGELLDLQVDDVKSNQQTKPLRLLVLGQTNSGKSSLINVLFGDVTAASDVLPVTDCFTSYQLSHEKLPSLLIRDSVGYDLQPPKGLENELAQADCVLLLCKANEAARQVDRMLITQFREYFQAHPEVAAPPLLVLCTHIDKLPPFREWQPPYNIAEPQCTKEHNILAAMQTLAEELSCTLNDIIPVALHQPYNIQHGVIPAILERLPAAQRAQYLNSLRRHEQADFWQQLGEQALSSGRVIGTGIQLLWQRLKS